MLSKWLKLRNSVAFYIFFCLLVQIIKSDIPSPLINFNLGRLNIFDGIMAKDN